MRTIAPEEDRDELVRPTSDWNVLDPSPEKLHQFLLDEELKELPGIARPRGLEFHPQISYRTTFLTLLVVVLLGIFIILVDRILSFILN